MRTIESMLTDEIGQLKKILKRAKKDNETVPEGTLRVRKWKNVVEYYYRNDEADDASKSRRNGRYLKKKEVELARRIAQRDYNASVIKNVEERIKAIERFLQTYRKTNLKQLYQDMNPLRRDLITASVISDDEFIKQWQAVEYVGKMLSEKTQEIITERGEWVRSKSEKIIADKLYALGIPYRYEYPLILEENIKIYPDFTILRMPEREEVYLEHFGMMDDIHYVDKVMYKLNTYERNGIYIGVNLFVTYETSKRPINTRALDGLIRSLFCEK